MPMLEPFVSAVALPLDDEQQRDGYPWELPAVRALARQPLKLHPGLTYS